MRFIPEGQPSRHSRWGACFLFVDGDLQIGLEFNYGFILMDGDLADELSHHALVELGDISLLIFQEILQLGDSFLQVFLASG